MKKLASGGLTLRLVNTIYDIKLAPFVVSIPTDAGGGNPVLTGAKSKLVVTYLNEVVAATITSLVTTNCNATHALGVVSITAISADTGQVQVNFTVDGNALSAVLTWAIAKQGGQGESGYTVVLTNEAHTLPATYAGIVTAEEIAKASSSIRVFKGAVELTSVAANAMPGIGQFRYNLGTVTGGTANRIDNSSFTLVSITADTALINVNVHCEGSMVIAKMMTVTKSKAGAPGDNGEPGPLPQGGDIYDPSKQYIGNSVKVDIVRFDDGTGEKAYSAKPTSGNIPVGTLPTNAVYWNEFGAQFESVATKLFFAKLAFIENLGVRYLRTQASGRRREIDGPNNTDIFYDEFNRDLFTIEDDVDYFYDDDGNNTYRTLAGATFKKYYSSNPSNPDTVKITGNGIYSNAGSIAAAINFGMIAYGAVIGYIRRAVQLSTGDIQAGLVGLTAQLGTYGGYFKHLLTNGISLHVDGITRLNGGQILAAKIVNVGYQVTLQDYIIGVNNGSGDINLPTVGVVNGLTYEFTIINASGSPSINIKAGGTTIRTLNASTLYIKLSYIDGWRVIMR